MLQDPKVIGFIPTYNSEKFISKTLEALAVQTYSNLELWICDDASTDNTASVCRDFCKTDKRFKFYQNEKNLGWWKTSVYQWQKAAKESDYCFFQPHDDVPFAEFVAAQVDLLQRYPNASLCVPGMKNNYADGRMNSTILQNLGTSDCAGLRIKPLVTWEVEGWWAAYHGLQRSRFIPSILPIDYLRFGEKEFALDLIWLIKMAALGPFVCSDQVLFEKFYTVKTLSVQWKYNFKNRSAVYLAMAEAVFGMRIPSQDKWMIWKEILKKSWKSLLMKIPYRNK
ncbi:glycosyltransferase family 2 protein [Algoriphagus litoralis]|uniref:glycosyltransferase family 2 protein n=1 Tax=Algoriphagus litoralis TaxID=2202829 RepID=UPI000DBA0C95|nr:glycosyltransferase family A protein [Algoriphagus litoralis]